MPEIISPWLFLSLQMETRIGEPVVLVTFGIAMTAGVYNFNKLYLQDLEKISSQQSY